jgi:hypothetical protein
MRSQSDLISLTLAGTLTAPLDQLKHDAEKWVPVFGKDHAPPITWSVMTNRREVITL